MAKIKIIASDDLVRLRDRINSDIDEAHRMIEQLSGETERNPTAETRKNLIDQKNTWQTRIECHRAALSNIAYFTSEIEI